MKKNVLIFLILSTSFFMLTAQSPISIYAGITNVVAYGGIIGGAKVSPITKLSTIQPTYGVEGVLDVQKKI